MKGYTTKAAVENYILQTIDASFDDQVTAWIESIETFIEQQTGRVFIVQELGEDEDAEVRLFDGSGSSALLIDDCLEVGDITINETLFEGTVYEYPANKTPKNKLVLSGGYFPQGNLNISIAGLWGYSATVPADLKMAATILVAGIIKYSNNKVRTETVGSYSISYDSDKGWQDFDRAMSTINSYKKFSF